MLIMCFELLVRVHLCTLPTHVGARHVRLLSQSCRPTWTHGSGPRFIAHAVCRLIARLYLSVCSPVRLLAHRAIYLSACLSHRLCVCQCVFVWFYDNKVTQKLASCLVAEVVQQLAEFYRLRLRPGIDPSLSCNTT